MATVGEYCNRNVVTATRDEGLLSVAERMRQNHVGCVVIVDESGSKRRAVGVLTDRDIVVRVLARTDRYIEQVRADDVMEHPPVTARESDDVTDAMRRMRAAGVRRLVVVDESNALVGLLSFDDLIDYLQGAIDELAALIHRERRREERVLA